MIDQEAAKKQIKNIFVQVREDANQLREFFSDEQLLDEKLTAINARFSKIELILIEMERAWRVQKK